MKRPIYEYEVGVPAHEYWVYRVRASSLAEAARKVASNSPDVEQVYSEACPPGRRRPKIMEKRLIAKAEGRAE